MPAVSHKPVRRKPVRRSKARRRSRPILRVTLIGVVAVAALLLWASFAHSAASHANTARQNFDAIIVLGTPTDSDGNPTPVMLDRVSEGVREYERGVAPRIIFTGSAAHNHFTEAAAMARIAHSRGVPEAAILQEPRALDTMQNACYSARMLHERGLHSAEVVSSPTHMPRAAMIFAHLPADLALEWRVHSAANDLTPAIEDKAANVIEIFKTARYLVWARWTESCPA